MSLWRQMTRGLRALRNRGAADREVSDEVGHYLEEATAMFKARGLGDQEARRLARLEVGNVTTVREEVRGSGWESAIETFFSDLRYVLHRLGRKPGFTATSLVTVALGIGATSAIFSVVNGVLLKPLPYPEANQIVALRHTAPGIHIDDLNMAASLYFTYSEENRVFQSVGIWMPDSATVTGVGEPEVVPALSVTSSFLKVLEVQPAMGRAFSAADDVPGGEQTVILTDGYWKSHFGGERSALGRRILMDGEAHTVIGVMPPTFEFMERTMSVLTPLRMNRGDIRLVSFCCDGIARLKPGRTLAQADADVARMLPMAALKFPVNPGFSANVWATSRIAPRLRFLKDSLIGDIGKTLWLLMATVGIVLLIACANVANLLLVRVEGRQQELAVRAALGAGLGRMARELLLESTLLGVAGGGLGLALAWSALRLVAAGHVEHLPRIHDISIDPIVVAFTICTSLISGLLFGLIPVIKYARPELSNTLRSAGRLQSQSKERHRARHVLVIGQVAMALVLLIGSGLMIRTFEALRQVDPGFAGAQEIQTLRIGIPDAEAKEPQRVIHTEEEILRKIEAIAGVSKAAMISTLPFDGGSNDPVYAEGRGATPGEVPPIRRYKFVSPGYFSTGARLITGRDLTWAETYNESPVALVSENMAREMWGDARAAIGKRIRPTLKDDWREVIGVVADLHDDGIDQKAPGIVYWPLLQKNFESSETGVARSVAYVIRTRRAGSTALIQDLERGVASVNPNLPLADVKTLESVYERSLARTSFTLVMLSIAGGMALVLGSVGIYGVISYSVSQRTREIGIRLALGAPIKNVTTVFVREGLVLSGIGAVFGLTAAFALTRFMKSLLYDVRPADPFTYAGVSVGLILIATAASYLPARKATKVDPCEALRAE